MIESITDVHSHILPGLDDGSESMEETLEALRLAVRQNVHAVIATPHFYPQRYEPTPQQIYASLREVNNACLDEGIPIRLYPGNECMYHAELVERLNQKRILTLAGSRYVLVEFLPDCAWSYLQTGLRTVRSGGYLPVLAHFERYDCLFHDGHLEELLTQGYLLQMNFDRLREKYGAFKKNPWMQYVQDGAVDFLGSDCHGTHYRTYHIDEACQWLTEHVEEKQLQRMLRHNIQKILYNL